MSKIIDIDKRRSNQEIMDIEVRFERQASYKQVTKIKPLRDWKRWRPGEEHGDLGFPEDD